MKRPETKCERLLAIFPLVSQPTPPRVDRASVIDADFYALVVELESWKELYRVLSTKLAEQTSELELLRQIAERTREAAAR